MPSFSTVSAGELMNSSNLNQVIEALNGQANIPISITGVNDATNWALDVRNQSVTNQRSFRVRDSSGSARFTFDSNGVRADSTGAGLGLVVTRADNATINSSMLSTGAATNFVSTTMASSQAISSGSAFSSMLGMNLPITTIGGPVYIHASGPVLADSTLAIVQVGWQVDGGGYTVGWAGPVVSTTINATWSFVAVHTPSASTHTYNLGITVQNSSAHLNPASVPGVFTAVEYRR